MHPIPMIRAALLAAVLGASGCASLAPGTPPPPSIDRAQALEQRGDFAAAAREYDALAASDPGSGGNRYRLQAARAWLAAGSPAETLRALQALATPLPAADQLERQLLEAEAALALREPAKARATLGALPVPADAAAATRYLALRQRAAIAAGHPVEGVRTALDREKRAGAGAASELRRELLEQLRAASEAGVKLDPRAAGNDAVVRGWLEAGTVAAQAARAPAPAALAAWRGRYPGHPAGDALRAAQPGARPAARPDVVARPLPAAGHVAVLLPVSGRNAAAGQQVRDGILAAYYAEPAATRPKLHIYDTGGRPVAELLDDAARAGAGFVIGPLTRDEVAAAAAWNGRRPPLLALNFLQPETTPADSRFFQFALSPEDEARMAARRAVADGRRRALAIVPAGDWGERVLAAFRAELETAGGQLLASTSYPPGSSDLSGPLRAALRLADSEARHRRLESALGTSLSFQPRRRGDVDFLFTPAPAAAARRLRPQLRFHYAGDIPAYATSDAFEPAGGNRDIEGLVFPDMPWVLQPGEGAPAALRAQLTAAWGEGGARSRGRLFAFGHDAWLLQRTIRAGGTETVSGVSGRLSIGADRYVRRDLDWAVARDGGARTLEPPP